MAPRLLELADELRQEGMAIGTSELMDAFEALRYVSWTGREDFFEALAATLAKSREDRRVLELVFDRFFFRAAEREAAASRRATGPRARASRADRRSWTSSRCASGSATCCATPTRRRGRSATSPGWRSPPSAARARARA
jgi:uncharacterized protein with von Willebrand factor type A (vWA) domain